ncbi:zinc finger MYM-type protein 2-like [Ptychodera flava]|uniref:zinc finger MYM-type protein 2-like n=1 Tax=Ptychodera flava TaxID=63121 RepID=UPI00396A0112
MSTDDLQYWMSKLVLDVRKVDGHPYPPKTALSLIMGLKSYICFERQTRTNFLADQEFVGFRQVLKLDAEMKSLSSIGIGTNKKQAETMSTEQIDVLWKMKLDDHSSRVLVRTMVFLNGKNFALRSEREHRALRFDPPQIIWHEPDGNTPYLLYVEDVSKSNQGGLKHMKVRRKEVKHYANTDNPARCHVWL